jgi:hypothetical protein
MVHKNQILDAKAKVWCNISRHCILSRYHDYLWPVRRQLNLDERSGARRCLQLSHTGWSSDGPNHIARRGDRATELPCE